MMVIFLTMPAMRRSLRDREVSTAKAKAAHPCLKHTSSLHQACVKPAYVPYPQPKIAYLDRNASSKIPSALFFRDVRPIF
jgi:hypothetical protein